MMTKRSTPQPASFLLVTKLHRPVTSAPLVPRPRLLEELTNGLSKRLTLISAPAGYGKTTAVNRWLDTVDLPSAWISCEADGHERPGLDRRRGVRCLNSCSVETEGFEARLGAQNSWFLQNMSLEGADSRHLTANPAKAEGGPPANMEEAKARSSEMQASAEKFFGGLTLPIQSIARRRRGRG